MLLEGASSPYFLWDYRVHNSLYLLEGSALRQSRELVGLTPF